MADQGRFISSWSVAQRVEAVPVLSAFGQSRIVYRVSEVRRILYVDCPSADVPDVTRSLTRGGADILRIDGDANDAYVDALDSARRRATSERQPFVVAEHVGCYGHRAHDPHAIGDVTARHSYRIVPEHAADTLPCYEVVRAIIEPSASEVR